MHTLQGTHVAVRGQCVRVHLRDRTVVRLAGSTFASRAMSPAQTDFELKRYFPHMAITFLEINLDISVKSIQIIHGF